MGVGEIGTIAGGTIRYDRSALEAEPFVHGDLSTRPGEVHHGNGAVAVKVQVFGAGGDGF